MARTSSEYIDQAIVVCQLAYAAFKLPCFMIDMVGDRVIEIPKNLIDDCFCSRLAKAANTELDITHAFKRFRDVSEMDSSHAHSCPYGLTAISVPLKFNNEPVAVITFCPILTRDPQEILDEHVNTRTDLDDTQVEALRDYLFSLKQYDTDFLEAFSQIITMTVDKNSENLCAPQVPVGKTDWCSEEIKHYTCPDTVEAALQFIADNYTRDIALTDVADHVFVHPTHLSKLFNKYASFSFRDYLNRMRIAKARSLLMDPRRTIASICYKVGFSDQSYFNRVFKSIVGITPGQYREQNLPQRYRKAGALPAKEGNDTYQYLRDNALV
ncbi:MAG: helix-turn-helix domain-containing protein [Coriobacteriia bacterium]|nr:helix-turn-helix domain-containing protein [Coriobacteriia bacterium]